MNLLVPIMAPAALATLALATVGIWAVFCRLRVMSPTRTKWAVAAQHAALAVGLFSAAVWSFNWDLASEFGAYGWVIDLLQQRDVGTLVLVASVLIYLLMSSHRWRFRAPEGTERESEF